MTRATSDIIETDARCVWRCSALAFALVGAVAVAALSRPVAAVESDRTDRFERTRVAEASITAAEISRIVVQEALKSREVSPALALALAKTVSRFKPDAEQKDSAVVTAIGVMAVPVVEARRAYGVSAEELTNPRLNTQLGIAILESLFDRRHGRVDLALADYRRGSTASPTASGADWEEARAFSRRVLIERRRLERSATVARLIAEIDRANISLAKTVERATEPNGGGDDWRTHLDLAGRMLERSNPGNREASTSPADVLLERIADTRRRFRAALARERSGSSRVGSW